MNYAMRVVAAAAILLAPALAARAQDFPSRPIRLIVPAGPGTIVDPYLRIMMRHIEQKFKQPVVFDYQAGAGGALGTRQMLRSDPDGYTVGFLADSYVSRHLTSKDAPYKWPDDFALLHQGVRIGFTLVGAPKGHATDFASLLAYARANPGKLNAATAGLFTASHVLNLLLQQRAGITVTQVNYKTSPAALQAVMTGEADSSPARGSRAPRRKMVVCFNSRNRALRAAPGPPICRP